jgi:hypothetical protein
LERPFSGRWKKRDEAKEREGARMGDVADFQIDTRDRRVLLEALGPSSVSQDDEIQDVEIILTIDKVGLPVAFQRVLMTAAQRRGKEKDCLSRCRKSCALPALGAASHAPRISVASRNRVTCRWYF